MTAAKLQTSTKKTAIALLSCLAVATIGIGVFLWRSHSDRRSVPGKIVRFLRGEDGTYQILNDMAEDIRQIPTLAELQPWGMETLKRFREGKVETNGYAQFYWDEPSAVKLARHERPEFIKRQWGETNEFGDEEPEIFIVIDANKQPEAVAIGWYTHRIQIGPPEYRLSYPTSYFAPYVQAKPGIFVYGNYK